MNGRGIPISNGWFVVHKLAFNGRSFSVWMDAANNMVDCALSRGHKGRLPKRGGDLWQGLESLARLHKPKVSEHDAPVKEVKL